MAYRMGSGASAYLVCAALVVGLAGCGGSATGGSDTSTNATATALNMSSNATENHSTPDNAPSLAGTVSVAPAKIAAKNDALDFSYEWPGEAVSIPALDGWLRSNAETLRKRASKDAEAAQADSKKEGYPFRQYSYGEKFTALANTPAVLVLQSEGYEYTGGAHGMPISTDIIWDKAGGKRLATSALIDLPAFIKVATPRYCKELDRQRTEKRGKEAGNMGIDAFTQCVPLAEQGIVPTSRGGKALDTIRILIPPYSAGPYAEGIYLIELPMDAAMLATVKASWKSAFTTGM